MAGYVPRVWQDTLAPLDFLILLVYDYNSRLDSYRCRRAAVVMGKLEYLTTT
jgi:hypothetical protein